MRPPSVVRTSVSLLLAAALVAPMSTAAATHTVEAGSGGRRAFTPRTLSIARGDRVRWDSVSGTHDVTSRLPGYFQANGQLASSGEYARSFMAAGTFGYVCMFHAGMTGSIAVPIRVSLSRGLFTIRVATASSSGTRWRNRIQVRRPGSSAWQTITTTTRSSATYDPGARGTYRFRSAVVNTNTGARSSYSPVVARVF